MFFENVLYNFVELFSNFCQGQSQIARTWFALILRGFKGGSPKAFGSDDPAPGCCDFIFWIRDFLQGEAAK